MLRSFFILFILFHILLLVTACDCGDPSTGSGQADDDDSSLNPKPDDDDADDDFWPDDDTASADPFILDNGDIRVVLEESTGHVLQITDLRKGIDLLRDDVDRGGFAPFAYRILTATPIDNRFMPVTHDPGEIEIAYAPEIEISESDYAGGHRRNLRWLTKAGVVFEATIDIPAQGAWVEFSGGIIVADKMIYSIAYPWLYGAAHLSGDGSGDKLALPWESGVEIDNPIEAAKNLFDNRFILYKLHYPNGHHMTLPMVGYYSSEAGGGFMMHSRDPEWTERLFSFCPEDEEQEDGMPTFSFWALNWDVDGAGDEGPGRMRLEYPIRVEAMDHGDWAGAGQVYRRWFESLPLASSPIIERSPERRRIFEKMSISVFGLSGSEDQSEWMRVFHELFSGFVPGDGVLFTPGWDFHVSAADFGGYDYAFYQAGWNEKWWLPYAGSFTQMAQAARQRGDMVYPFYYDLLLHDGYPGWEGWEGDAQSSGDLGAPWKEHASVNQYGLVRQASFDFVTVAGEVREMCPADPTSQEFYLWRNELLATGGEDGPYIVDGFYHDITGTVVGRYCFACLKGFDHGHDECGWGRFITKAERDLLAEAMGPNRQFSFGVESVTEPFVDVADYSHLGLAGDGPYRSCFAASSAAQPEFGHIDKLILDGSARQIPLLEYVTHEFGSMRAGGKVQISERIGDAWYWVAAYNYVHGGILELIYFNTPTDLLPGINPANVFCPMGWPCSFMTSWIAVARNWYDGEMVMQADEDKIAFLQDCADLRLRLGEPFLTAGRMLPPPAIDPEPEPEAMSYDFYSSIAGESYEHYGDFAAPPLMASAFADPQNPTRVALFAANVSTQAREITLSFDPARYGTGTPVSATMRTAGSDAQSDMGEYDTTDDGRIEIAATLEARTLIAIVLE
jgi:hypothetical protein